MKEKNLFVGYGIEAYQASTSRKLTRDPEGKAFTKGQDEFHLILLAQSPEGYRNLLRISDEANKTGFYYNARVDWELLDLYKEGLICTTACAGSLMCKALQDGNVKPISKLHEIFGDNLRVEISTYDTDGQRALNHDLVRVASDRGIQLIYANDAHYTTPDLFDTHEALICAQYGEFMLAPKKYTNHATDATYHHPPCLYIMDEDDVRERLSHLPDWAVDEAIDASDELMELCAFELEKPGLYLPKFAVPEEYEDSADMLDALITEGIAERYEITDEVMERIETEYDAIVGAGLQDYFLIVWDFINYALRHGVMVGPGRGSVGGSIMAYALGITDIDPLKYGLQFERFWNPGRADGLPDIDVDFEQSARQFMIEYVKRKYTNVLPIGNHIFIRPKSAIDKAAMVLYADPPYGNIVEIKKIIERTVDAGQQPPWDEMWEQLGDWAAKEGEEHPLEKYQKLHPELFELAEALEGRISTYGAHASAVVISAVELNDHLPARMAKDDNDGRKVLVTQAEMKQVEKAGFPKFDFLGLRNLDTIMMTAILSGEFGDPDVLGPKLLKMIEERSKGSLAVTDDDLREQCVKIVQHFRGGVNYNALPDSYWDLIDQGNTLGLFQIEESSSPRRIGKKMLARNIEDLAAIVALNRPGPLRDKGEDGRSTVDRFLMRRTGEEEASYHHPILEDICGNTFGDFLYQEQVIAYFRAIGYSLSDADHIRKILGKKLVSEMQAEFPTYMERAQEHMPKQNAERIWQAIEEFSKYSFNKAHSVGYGMITAWTMYAKRKWPLEFIMASITTVSSTTNGRKKIPSYINEARRLGVPVLPPDIARSIATITKDNGEILFGLRDVKGIGDDTAAWIVKHGPWESPEAFYAACVDDDLKAMVNGKKTVVVKANHRQALMDVGAFDSFGYRLKKCPKCDGKGRCRIDPAKRILDDCPSCNKLGYIKDDIPDVKERAAYEEDLLTIALTNPHEAILIANQDEIETLDSLADAGNEEKTRIWVPGVVKKVDQKQATWHLPPGTDPTYAQVIIEWEGEQIRFVAFPDKYKKFKYMLTTDTVGKFKLETSKKGPQLLEGKKLTT